MNILYSIFDARHMKMSLGPRVARTKITGRLCRFLPASRAPENPSGAHCCRMLMRHVNLSIHRQTHIVAGPAEATHRRAALDACYPAVDYLIVWSAARANWHGTRARTRILCRRACFLGRAMARARARVSPGRPASAHVVCVMCVCVAR